MYLEKSIYILKKRFFQKFTYKKQKKFFYHLDTVKKHKKSVFIPLTNYIFLYHKN